MTTQPILPYGEGDDANSGYSGSDTSEQRAREADRTGVTAARQARALLRLHQAGDRGLTWREFATAEGLHHGQASGALSNLHKVGRISRLVQARDKCKIYVLPSHVNGRATSPPRGWKRDPWFERAMPILARAACPLHEEAQPWCAQCQVAEASFRLLRDYQRDVQSR